MDKLKDNKGNQLTRAYLIKTYSECDPLFKDVFDEGNKYIHPSKIFQDASKGYVPYYKYKCPEEEYKRMQAQMIYVNNILANVLIRWIHLKHGTDVGLENLSPDLITYSEIIKKEEEALAKIPDEDLPEPN